MDTSRVSTTVPLHYAKPQFDNHFSLLNEQNRPLYLPISCQFPLASFEWLSSRSAPENNIDWQHPYLFLKEALRFALFCNAVEITHTEIKTHTDIKRYIVR